MAAIAARRSIFGVVRVAPIFWIFCLGKLCGARQKQSSLDFHQPRSSLRIGVDLIVKGSDLIELDTPTMARVMPEQLDAGLGWLPKPATRWMPQKESSPREMRSRPRTQ
jgi:hypothetical protein